MQNTHYGRYAQGFGLPKETKTIPVMAYTATRQCLSGLPLLTGSLSCGEPLSI